MSKGETFEPGDIDWQASWQIEQEKNRQSLARIAELETQYETYDEHIRDLEASADERSSRIAELEAENADLLGHIAHDVKRIAELEALIRSREMNEPRLAAQRLDAARERIAALEALLREARGGAIYWQPDKQADWRRRTDTALGYESEAEFLDDRAENGG